MNAGAQRDAQITREDTESAASTAGNADGRRASESLNLRQVVSSIFAAGLGVQSSKNRERDFKQGRAGTFIAAGLVFTLLFIGSVYTVVTLVLSSR